MPVADPKWDATVTHYNQQTQHLLCAGLWLDLKALPQTDLPINWGFSLPSFLSPFLLSFLLSIHSGRSLLSTCCVQTFTPKVEVAQL